MENGFEQIEKDKFRYLKKEGVFRYKDDSAPDLYRYEIASTVLRELGDPDADGLPSGLTLYPDLMPNLIDEDMVLLPHVKVIYSEADHGRWKRLFNNIETVIPGRVVQEVTDGFKWIRALGGADRIPSLEVMNKDITAISGFELVQVVGLLPNDSFFKLLMDGKFPVTLSVRKEEEFAYTSFPDIFHDLAGHAPMFLNATFCDFVRKMGALGMRFAGDDKLQAIVGKIYWYTIEFGLKAAEMPAEAAQAAGRNASRTGEPVRSCLVYGAGIVSSVVETCDSVDADTAADFDNAGNRIAGKRKINRLPFDLQRVMSTHYDYDKPQEIYFVIDSYRQLTELFDHDLEGLIREFVAQEGDSLLPPGTLLETDVIIPIYRVAR